VDRTQVRKEERKRGDSHSSVPYSRGGEKEGGKEEETRKSGGKEKKEGECCFLLSILKF